jgi:hypothetical protein
MLPLREMLRARGLFLAALASTALAAAPAEAQFVPYFGKNQVRYDTFSWRIYKGPHFEVYYYPEFEQHLARVVSYLESAYQKISSDLKHEVNFPIPVILYKTSSEFQQSALFPAFLPGAESILGFTEPVRDRMVLPIDLPPDKLQGLITHELTHAFAFDLIPRSLIRSNLPLWVDEGLASYMEGLWDPLDLAMLRDATITEQVPRLSRSEFAPLSGRLVYNLGHAAFEFIEGRYGKEGIRQFLYTLRKNIVGGSVEDIYQQAFRSRPEEFDQSFEKWLQERFKLYRDKQRPSDYGQELSPNAERTPYAQVYAFSPSPSGEMVAALTANRGDGEADVVLLSARDGSVIRNLTPGYTGAYENISASDDFVAGRNISFDPSGERVAFFARAGKRRTLVVVSVLSARIERKLTPELDQAQSPCLLSDGRHVLFAAIKEGVSDIYMVDLESGEAKNLTQDAFADSNPQISPDGTLVVYNRRISGHDKIWVFPLRDPSRKTQLSFGAHDDVAPAFSSDGATIYYSSTEDDDIFNIRSLDLRTGAIRQFTDTLGSNTAPAVLRGKGSDRLAFISYFKGEYRLQAIDTGEPLKEVEQEVAVASSEIVDFQPDVVHQVVPQAKRKKRMFEKLFLEGRPPLNVGVTSGGDFFGGTQVALTDVLADQSFLFTALSFRELRSFSGTWVNLSSRLQYGISAFDSTRFFYSSPYNLQRGFSREGAFAIQRYTGGLAQAVYPLDKFRRLELSGGVVRLEEHYDNPLAEELVRQQAEALGIPFFLNNGTLVPLSAALVQETTRFREFGPLTGSTFSLGVEFAPPVAGMLSRTTVDADLRKYLRFGSSSTLLAVRARGFHSSGDNPGIFYFGGNMELRGYPYLSFSGNRGFFANVELRFPVIDLAATPIGILGPLRGTIYAGIGGAHYQGERFTFASSDPDLSFVNDPLFGEPVSGFHLVDGRASYGIGLQLFFLGYPLHFDWTKLTDLKVTTESARFDFWIGFDF